MAFKVPKRKEKVFARGLGHNRETFARFEFCPAAAWELDRRKWRWRSCAATGVFPP
jgi:hypothetical protein